MQERPSSCDSRLAFAFAFLFFVGHARAMANGVALTPPMGYNSWYSNGAGITEALIKDVADQMATNGMKAAGYLYVNLDDGWAGYRDTNGNIVADPVKFPSGIKALADYIHAKGLKIGLYSGGGPMTCAGLPGSMGYEIQDANAYASWGIDYLKYEGCYVPGWELIPHEQLLSMRMGQALLASGRPMVYSLSIGPFENWIPDACNLPRATGDLDHTWQSVLFHIDVVASSPFPARPGMFNDPDMLDLAFGHSRTEEKAIFTMWSMLAAPLLTPSVDWHELEILCNTEVIAVDQDPATIQAVCIATNGDLQVWRKPLGSSNSTTIALALLNRGSNSVSTTVNWSDIGLPPGVATVRDLWAKGLVADVNTGNISNQFSTNIPPHGVALYKIVPGASIPLPVVGTNYVSDLQLLASTSNQFEAIVLDKFVGIPTSQIALHGVAYGKGLGVQAYSRAEYYLGKTATRFMCDVGVDDRACCGPASVIFRVYADGAKLFDSGLVTSATPTRTIDVDVTGRNILALEVTTAGDGEVNDQADWAGARILVPSVPSGPTATGGAGQITVTWNPVPGATNYNVKRSSSSGGPYQFIGSTGATGYTDTNVVAGTLYFYAITAMRSGVESSNSVQVSAAPVANWKNVVVTTNQNWNANTNWTNTTAFPNTPGAAAMIHADIPSNQTINLNQNITVGSLSIGDSNGSSSYFISGNGGTLVFSNGPNPAILVELSQSKGDTILAPVRLDGALAIDNYSGNPLTVSGTVSGGGALTARGPGVLLLSGSNTFANAVTIFGGTLRIGNSLALGNSNSGTTIATGGTLDVNGFNLGAEQISVAGAGADGNGAVISTGASAQSNAVRFLTLAGDAVLGGIRRWDIRGTNISVPSGTLSTGNDPHSLTKKGTNTVAIAAVTVDPSLADIDVQEGTLRFEGATTSMGNPNNTLTVEAGATLAFFNTSTAWNKKFALNGDGLAVTLRNTSGSNTIVGSVALSGTCILDVSGTALALKGAIGGTGGLTKISTSPLYLYGTNNHAGRTEIDSGALIIGNTGSMAASTNIYVANGALFDVSAMPGGGMTLAAGQTLSGTGAVKGKFIASGTSTIAPGNPFGTLTFSNSLAFNAGSTCIVAVGKGPKTNTLIRVSGSVTYGGALIVNRIGTNTLAAGDSFALFNAGSYAGAFTTIIPQAPGPSLVWDTTSLATNGTLKVVEGIVPYYTSLTANGTNFSFGGLGARPNATYYILGSTNLYLPKPQWPRLATNVSDAAGAFSYSYAIKSNSPSMYFCVLVP